MWTCVRVSSQRVRPEVILRSRPTSRPSIPPHIAPRAQGDSLIFVLGDGWAHWINPSLTTPLRPAPHGMVMQSEGSLKRMGSKMGSGMGPGMGSGMGSGTPVRLWHGRMVLPPDQVPLLPAIL